MYRILSPLERAWITTTISHHIWNKNSKLVKSYKHTKDTTLKLYRVWQKMKHFVSYGWISIMTQQLLKCTHLLAHNAHAPGCPRPSLITRLSISHQTSSKRYFTSRLVNSLLDDALYPVVDRSKVCAVRWPQIWSNERSVARLIGQPD